MLLDKSFIDDEPSFPLNAKSPMAKKQPGSSINRVIELLKLPPRIVCVSLFVNLEGNSMFVSLRVLLYESIVKVIKLLLDNVIFLLSDSNFPNNNNDCLLPSCCFGPKEI